LGLADVRISFVEKDTIKNRHVNEPGVMLVTTSSGVFLSLEGILLGQIDYLTTL
jgi:hypothetical protein